MILTLGDQRLNPIAVSFVVFFLAFLSIDTYSFTQSATSEPLIPLILISVVFAVVAGYSEYDWYLRQDESEEEEEEKK